VDCDKLFLTSLKYAATKFVPLCEGILDMIRDQGTYKEDPVAFLIDLLVVSYQRKVTRDVLDQQNYLEF
jgi:hypothetical protein